MTTVAKDSQINSRACRDEESGQSVIEFLIVLPVMVGLVMLLVRVNTVIQASIVNQQYVRAQTLFLAFNSAHYPELRLRKTQLDDLGYNQMILGMSEKAIAEGTNTQADASVFSIVSTNGKRNANPGSDEAQTEPEQRGKVRVRTTATLCTQTQVIANGSGSAAPIIELAAGSFTPTSISKLTENSRFDYCRAPRGRYVQ